MRRWVVVAASIAVLIVAAIIAFVATRPPPFDAFPVPPSPSIAPDGARSFTMLPGTMVNFLPSMIEPGDEIVCTGKGRTTVPPEDHEINGPIYVYTDPTGAVVASCAPHPVVAM